VDFARHGFVVRVDGSESSLSEVLWKRLKNEKI